MCDDLLPVPKIIVTYLHCLKLLKICKRESVSPTTRKKESSTNY